MAGKQEVSDAVDRVYGVVPRPRSFDAPEAWPRPKARFHRDGKVSVNGGLLLTIMESVGLDWDNTRRGYRYVTFDLFGNVVSRVALEDCWKSREPARKAMWAFLNTTNAVEINLEAAQRYRASMTQALDELDEKLTDRDLAA